MPMQSLYFNLKIFIFECIVSDLNLNMHTCKAVMMHEETGNEPFVQKSPL